jgi:hypothetical protein
MVLAAAHHQAPKNHNDDSVLAHVIKSRNSVRLVHEPEGRDRSRFESVFKSNNFCNSDSTCNLESTFLLIYKSKTFNPK